MDPRYHYDFYLQGLADSVIERRRRKGLAAESTLVLMTVLPAFLVWNVVKIGLQRLSTKTRPGN